MHDIDQAWYICMQMMPQPLARLLTFAAWDKLVSLGPAYGYHVNAKQSHHAAGLSAFHDTQITITAEGWSCIRHLPLCTTLCKKKGCMRVGLTWAQELNQLASIAANNPHAAYMLPSLMVFQADGHSWPEPFQKSVT